MGRGPDYMDDGDRSPSDRLCEISGHLGRISDAQTREALLREARELVAQLPIPEQTEWISALRLNL